MPRSERRLATVVGIVACCTAITANALPNILFIAIDDLRPECGAYGGRAITPNIDRLAGDGTRFDRAYCQQAVCGASRTSVMCGLYPTYTGEQTFHVSGWRDRHPNVLTLNQHLRKHGYHTVGIGKIYHDTRGPGADAANWDELVTLRSPVHTYALNENRELMRQGRKRTAAGGSRDRSRGPTTEMADVPDDAYPDGRVADQAVAVIKRLREREQEPFFFAIGFTKPHLPFAAPKKYWELYRREDLSMPKNTGVPPGYPRGATNPLAGEMRAYSDYMGESPRDFSVGMNKRLMHGYLAAASYVDACVGRVLNAIEAEGLADSTLIVLWSDHGWKLGDHGSWCKHTNFECDTRVVLVLRDPRLDQVGCVSNKPVELIDVYPTLCELAGLPIPSTCQGLSLKPLLNEVDATHRGDAYSSYPLKGEHGHTGHSLRSGKYRYTEWRENATGEVMARVLTDLEADSGEETNLVDDPAHSQALALLASRLSRRIRQANSVE